MNSILLNVFKTLRKSFKKENTATKKQCKQLINLLEQF